MHYYFARFTKRTNSQVLNLEYALVLSAIEHNQQKTSSLPAVLVLSDLPQYLAELHVYVLSHWHPEIIENMRDGHRCFRFPVSLTNVPLPTGNHDQRCSVWTGVPPTQDTRNGGRGCGSRSGKATACRCGPVTSTVGFCAMSSVLKRYPPAAPKVQNAESYSTYRYRPGNSSQVEQKRLLGQSYALNS